MDELNLGDLDFDTSSLNLFEEGVDIVKPTEVPASEKLADVIKGDTTPASTDEKKNDKNKNTDGEDSILDPESVASQSKDKNQVQAGKTADGKEGSDSSSPKLNETEQLYSNLAAEFKSKGILPELEDTSSIKSMEDIEEAIKKQVESRLTSRQKKIEEAQQVGAPIEEVTQKVNVINKLKAVTPEYLKDDNNVKFRLTAIAQDFIEKGYDETRATAMAQRSVDAGTDVEDAEFALASLIQSEESSLQTILTAAKNDEQDSLKDIKEYIADTPEVIPGIALTDSQKDELYNQITTDLGNKESKFVKAQKADPIGSRIKLETLFFLTKGLTDFSIFGNKAETKISNNIENLLRGANFTEAGSVDTSSQDNNSNFKLSDLKDFDIE
jgi:hypothetical protein|tara:strand:- start:142 stop:1293 length:1152 start_codon:yes stop_codon:yes gene_type:complete